jgi:hypothetical protein
LTFWWWACAARPRTIQANEGCGTASIKIVPTYQKVGEAKRCIVSSLFSAANKSLNSL